MPITLLTLQKKIDAQVKNEINAKLLHDFDSFMDEYGSAESYRKNNLKAATYFAIWVFGNIGPETTLFDVKEQEPILLFLKQFKKPKDRDPDEKWKTTYNDYLARLKYFFRWLYNVRIPQRKITQIHIEDWTTPDFVKIKKVRTKRKSTYAVSETWLRHEVLTILPHEPDARNKAIIASLWDMDGRNHEACRMKNKHVQYFEKHARAEIPSNTKTGGGPVLLRLAFSYLLVWKNLHPFKNDPEAPLFCNMNGGKRMGDPLDPDYIWKITNNLKKNIRALLDAGKIKDQKEVEKLEKLLREKKWNPYCFRHSAIRHDATYLTHYALTQKVRWVPNSRQAGRYMAMTLSNDVEKSILAHDGIIVQEEAAQNAVNCICPKCKVVNAIENRLCQECSYPLTQEAFEEVRAEDNKKFEQLQKELAEQRNLITSLLKANLDKEIERGGGLLIKSKIPCVGFD